MTKEERDLARRLPGVSQMDRVRAARAMIEATGSEQQMLSAFLSIFHPRMSENRKRELIQSVRRHRP